MASVRAVRRQDRQDRGTRVLPRGRTVHHPTPARSRASIKASASKRQRLEDLQALLDPLRGIGGDLAADRTAPHQRLHCNGRWPCPPRPSSPGTPPLSAARCAAASPTTASSGRPGRVIDVTHCSRSPSRRDSRPSGQKRRRWLNRRSSMDQSPRTRWMPVGAHWGRQLVSGPERVVSSSRATRGIRAG